METLVFSNISIALPLFIGAYFGKDKIMSHYDCFSFLNTNKKEKF